jgi:tripartite motif-containing protein 71
LPIGYAYAEKYAFINKWGTPCSVYNLISPFCNKNAPGAVSIGDGQFNFPTDIALLSVDNPYVTDYDNNRVQKFDIDGQFHLKWGTICIKNTSNGCNTSAPGAVSPGDGQFYFPSGVAVDSSGHIYVADSGNHRIQKFDSNGKFLGKWGSYCNLNTSNGCNTSAPGAVSPGDGQFLFPRSITVDSSLGRVYVADTNNNRIEVFDTAGTFLGKWGSWCDMINGLNCNTSAPGAVSPGDGQFYWPFSIEVNQISHIVYIADSHNSRIEVFNSKGVYLGKWGSLGSKESQLKQPYGITIDSKGDIYVADSGNNRVQKFDAFGNFITTWGSLCSLPSMFGCQDPDGPLGKLQIGDGQFQVPYGIAVENSPSSQYARVFVADSANHRIQVFEQDNNNPETIINFAVDGNGTFITNGGLTSSASITFDFKGSDNIGISGFLCSLDGSNFSTCTSPHSYTGLKSNITHNFEVKSIDIAGNIDPTPAKFTWIIS